MYVLARLSFGFVVGALAVILALQGAVWLMGQIGLAAIQLFPMRAPLPASLPGLTQPAIIGGLWGLAFILIWDRWGRDGIVKGAGFGTLFGLVGPGNGDGGEYQTLVSEDRLAAEDRNDLATDTEERQGQNIDLRMAKEPEQVLPEDRTTIFRCEDN